MNAESVMNEIRTSTGGMCGIRGGPVAPYSYATNGSVLVTWEGVGWQPPIQAEVNTDSVLGVEDEPGYTVVPIDHVVNETIVKCAECDGKGHKVDCDTCDGEGCHECSCGDEHQCSECNGLGWFSDATGDLCEDCEGSGKQTLYDSVLLAPQIEIPGQHCLWLQALPGLGPVHVKTDRDPVWARWQHGLALVMPIVVNR